MSGVLCPSCGTRAAADASECAECGTSLFTPIERTNVRGRVRPAQDLQTTLDNDSNEVTPSAGGTPRASSPRRAPSTVVSDATLPWQSSADLMPLDKARTIIPPPPSSPVQGRQKLTLKPTASSDRVPAVLASPQVSPHLFEPPPSPQHTDTQPGIEVASPLKRDPLIGTKLGEYTVEERVGIGGMGIVYRAVQPMIGNSVAIKVLRPDIIGDEHDMQRFLGEARTVNSIRHRSIISIFGAGDTPDGRKYLVMEFLEGESLEARQQRLGKIPAADVLPILEDVLSALAAAHAANVVHRDLKPANVFLVHQSDGPPWVKLLDFGLARRGNNQDVSRIAGTPDYIAPEHARGKSPGPSADLYGFGVMAFHLLTGRLPFIGNTPMDVMEQHVNRAPPVPAEIDSSIPPALSELILRLLDKDPLNRPDAKTVKADLKAAAKQLRSARTQVGLPPIGAQGATLPAGFEMQATIQAEPIRVDPRLERLALAADQKSRAASAVPRPPERSAFARNWPWLAGGLALLWLLTVAVYLLLMPAPAPHTGSVPITPPRNMRPMPPMENLPPDTTGSDVNEAADSDPDDEKLAPPAEGKKPPKKTGSHPIK